MVKLYKEGEDISTPLQIGDIIEIESGIFVKIKTVIKETEETFVGIKKNNTLIKGEVCRIYKINQRNGTFLYLSNDSSRNKRILHR
jgi:preprotein translocase subunit YajC